MASACQHCGTDVSGTPQIACQAYDHVDIPPIRPETTRVTLHGGVCPCCARCPSSEYLRQKATLFDRSGYVAFAMAPANSELPAIGIRNMVEAVLSGYSPAADQSYFDFRQGDKVAAAGALGVLATLVGVKYGKAIVAGFMVIALALLKKLWFLLFVPLVVLWKIFTRKK